MRNKLPLAKRERINGFTKWAFYILIIVISFIYLMLPTNNESKPLLLIPVAICIAMNEKVMTSAIVGMICGFMLDFACGKIFGFNAALLLLLGMGVSLLFILLMRQNILNVLLITLAAAFIQGGLDFFFFYVIWGYDNLGKIFLQNFLPSIIFTTLWAAVYYAAFKAVQTRFAPPNDKHIEEKNDDISRE
ncbi:MAG: rod shape-determining protein MreD [Oscillospiraceae bacterium]